MKTATFPSVSVSADLREAAESVLLEGESLSGLIETAVREAIHKRQQQTAFIERGLRSSADARSSGSYHDAVSVHDALQAKLEARRKQVLG